MVRVELKFCSTTSVEYFSTPCGSVHLRVCSAPSIYTLAPFFRYCSATLVRPSLKITTRCHSVFSLRSPVALSRQVSDVAIRRLAIGRPSWVRLISGSAPRLPIRITLFTLPAIAALHSRNDCTRTDRAFSCVRRGKPVCRCKPDLPVLALHHDLGTAVRTDPIRSPIRHARRSPANLGLSTYSIP